MTHSRHVLIIDNSLRTRSTWYPIRRHVRAHYTVAHRFSGEIPGDISAYSHIILTGGAGLPLSISKDVEPLHALIRSAAKRQTPLLGICYGAQAIATAFGGDEMLRQYHHPEYGWVEVHQRLPHPLLSLRHKNFAAFENHVDSINSLPVDFITTASSKTCPVQAFMHQTLPIFGVQFHPEVTATKAKHVIHRARHSYTPDRWLHRPSQTDELYDPTLGRDIFRAFLNVQ